MSNQGNGLRFNQGKTRHDLVPPFAQEQYGLVLTDGAIKYAERNWEKGMPWSKVIASLKRHILAIERGEDFDPETGRYHSAHIMCNAAFLTEYYKIFPQGDDRPHQYLTPLRIGTDIDDVLCNFINAYCKKFGMPENPKFWEFDPQFWPRYQSLYEDEEFWLGLESIVTPEDFTFEPAVYITSRPEILRKFTERWLFEVKGYPVAPVVMTTDKVSTFNEYKLDKFIDDKFATFQKMNRAGQLCYLFTASHNTFYNVGHKRIDKKSFNQIS
jgi:hypothetical protein